MRRPAALPVLAALAVASFLFAVVGTVLAPEPAAESAAADSFSRSAIGHRALVEMLRRDGVPVVVSRWSSGRRAGAGAVLLVAEPELDAADAPARLSQMLADAQRAIVVLPKWTGEEDGEKRGWIKQARDVGDAARQRVLHALGVQAQVVRRRGVTCAGWPTPSPAFPAVLLAPAPGLTPLVTCGDGVLVAEIARAGHRVLVVSDPDVFANHGLGRGENAQVARAVIDLVRAGGETLVVDETLHGFQSPPSVWRELFRWPLAAALVQCVLIVAALVAAGLPRFGRDLPDEPALAPGKEVLVRNTSDLLAGRGYHGWLARRYVELARRDVLAALRAPVHAGPAAARAFLAEAERRRNVAPLAAVETQVERLDDRAPAAVAIRLAVRAHRWKEEMTRAARRRA